MAPYTILRRQPGASFQICFIIAFFKLGKETSHDEKTKPTKDFHKLFQEEHSIALTSAPECLFFAYSISVIFMREKNALFFLFLGKVN